MTSVRTSHRSLEPFDRLFIFERTQEAIVHRVIVTDIFLANFYTVLIL